MRKFLIISLFVSLFLLCGCANCSNCKQNQPASYEINFIVDGEHYLSDTVVFGQTINKPKIEDRQGYIFKCWYITDEYIEEWNFEKPVYTTVTLYAYWVETEKETFNVIYIDDGIPIHTEKVIKGSCIEKFIPEKEGFIFSDWKYNEQTYDFSTPVNNDITLSAVWNAINYKITFIADDEIVSEEYFTVDNLLVDIPDIPEKNHYTSKWDTFIYELKDIEVQAIYTAIVYTATFYVDNNVYREFTYTVEDEMRIPDVPAKIGYTGKWTGLPVAGGDITITAEYTPVDYTIIYKIDGKVVDTRTYNADNKDITPPAIPEISGYEGFWEDVELDIGDKTVNAFYSIKKLYAYFYINNELYEARTFTIENKNIDVPDVPAKEGYSGSWENYKLEDKDIIINAIYVKDTYTATFIIDDNIIDIIEFTADTTVINEPVISEQYQKKGYTVHWKEYRLSAQDIIIEAIYLPIKYTADFVINGQLIESEEFTFEDLTINEPLIPEQFKKDGYTVSWEQYNLDSGDIVVEAIYTPITYTAKFVIENNLYYETQFTVEHTDIETPEISEKYQRKGFSVSWDIPSISSNDIVVIAVYKLITYYASFTYNNAIIKKVPYNINDTVIEEPAPPDKDGYVAVWSDYTIPYEDFEVELLYFVINQTETVGLFKFTLSNDNTYTLTDYLVDDNLPLGTHELKIKIPAEVNHLPVTAIAEQAFAYKTNFNEIIIPDCITEIGSYAFTYTNIININLPNRLTHIKNIFVSCKNLKSVNIPASVKYIDANAFAGCTSITDVVFENCHNWHIYEDKNYENEYINNLITPYLPENLSNSEASAKFLTNTFLKYYWKNED